MSDHSVLVVEDDSTVQELFKYRLGKRYEVRGAANGEEGLRAVKENLPDLILSDIMMPRMDGIAFFNALQDNPQARLIPFIVVTARSDEETRALAGELGVDGYFTKPFNMDHVLIRVRRIFERIELFRGGLEVQSSDTSPLSVFLSHAKEDSEQVAQLYEELKDRGVNPWMDDKDLLPGQDWELEIEKAIRRSHVVLACLSQSSVDKRGYFQKEIRIALDKYEQEPEGAIFLVPVRLEECDVPNRLGDPQWFDFYREEEDFEDLLQALKRRAFALEGVSPPSGV